jgi:hypothetical protein
MGGGNQGGSDSSDDGETRRAHSEAGIPASQTRAYFREKENPASGRAANNNKSILHSKDEQGNLVAKSVAYGEGNFADGSIKPENILGKRDDIKEVLAKIGNATLSASGNSIMRTDPKTGAIVGTIGGVNKNGGLWGGTDIMSVLGAGAKNDMGVATGLVTPQLYEQNIRREEKYGERSSQFVGKSADEIASIRAANKAKNPMDRDGDGGMFTSTDDLGVVYGIGSADGSGGGGQPAIYNPSLAEGYRGIPQLDPNSPVDTNKTYFGSFMKKAGIPLASLLIPGGGIPLAAQKLDKMGFIPDALKGEGGVSTPTRRGRVDPDLPTQFATSGSGISLIDKSTKNAIEDALGALPNVGTSTVEPKDWNYGLNDPNTDYSEAIRANIKNKDYVKLNPDYWKDVNVDESKMPVAKFFRSNSSIWGTDDTDDGQELFDQVMPPVEAIDVQNRASMNYSPWSFTSPDYIGPSSWGSGKYSGGVGTSKAIVAGSNMPSGFTAPTGPANTVIDPWYNPTTGQYWDAPTGGYSAPSGWIRGYAPTPYTS